MAELSADDPRAPVTRAEFEGLRDFSQRSFRGLHDDIGKIAAKLDSIVQSRQLDWRLVIAIVGLVSAFFAFTISNLASVRDNATRIQMHQSSPGHSTALAEIRANASLIRGIAIEGETQNRWMADVLNLVSASADREARAFCVQCDREGRSHRVQFPDRDYWPLAHTGKADFSRAAE